MACQSVSVALQELSAPIQELASDPSSFVLHRSHCLCLAASYSISISHVLQQIQHTLSTCLDPQAQRELEPSLSELLHVILQGYKFMRDCLHQQGWVQKAVILALSTEAQDVHLHDLVWCLCVIQQAMRQLALQADEPDMNVYTSLNTIWVDTSQKDDLRVLSEALENEISGVLTLKSSTKEIEAQQSFATFLLKRICWEIDHANARAAVDKLPQCLWVEPNEFCIKESIGYGAYAVVHEVEWNGESYGQKEFFEVDEAVFAREAAIQASLRHPNLLQLICCTSKPSKNKCSLVMELMEANLRSVIDKRQRSGMNPPFSLLTSVDLMLQIAKGMEHLHGLHIMHRDLKSLNILVTNQVSTGGPLSDCRMHLRIADFGMSKAKNQSSKFTTLHVGTSYWRAPEVFHVNPETEFEGQSTAKYTKEADVYSFSMVCFEILSGKVPFDDGGKLGDLHERLLQGERPKLPSNSCPPYLASYIERCWDGNPGERPTFAQISRTLRHLKGILLTGADPLTPLALSVRSLSCIEDKLTQMMGTDWPSTVSGCVAMRTLTISFEMSWYTVMERELTSESITDFTQGSAIKRTEISPLSDVATSKSIGTNCHRSIIGSDRKKGSFSRAVGCIVVFFSWKSLKLSGHKLQRCMTGVTRRRIKRHPLKGLHQVMTIRWINLPYLMQILCCCSMLMARETSEHVVSSKDSSSLNTGLQPIEVGFKVPRFGELSAGGSRGGGFKVPHFGDWNQRSRRLYQLQDELRLKMVQQEFSYSELAEATNHFQIESLLGEGGSGKVFKGVLKSGEAIAVKVMQARGTPLDSAVEAEVDFFVCGASHPNLIPLLGYCFSEIGHLMLMYTFMPRGNLAQNLFNRQGHEMKLTWVHRRKIASGVASALDYLHNECTPQFLHRDVKPSNILLDDDCNAYLSDFGTAIRIADLNKEDYAVTGTRIFQAPEYVMTRQLGTETDVFAFGMVLLLLVCGQEYFEVDESGTSVSVLRYVERLYEEGLLLDAVDGRVKADGRYDAEMRRFLLIALACCAGRSKDRPSMQIVVKVLLGEMDAPIPTHLVQESNIQASKLANYTDASDSNDASSWKSMKGR